MKRVALILLAIAALVAGGLWLMRPASPEDVRFVEVPVSQLQAVLANHSQGGVGFTLSGEDYFYNIHGADDAQRILAASALLGDLQRATTAQIRSERYGLHRLVTNLLLFYGERLIPEDLRPKAPAKDK